MRKAKRSDKISTWKQITDNPVIRFIAFWTAIIATLCMCYAIGVVTGREGWEAMRVGVVTAASVFCVILFCVFGFVLSWITINS